MSCPHLADASVQCCPRGGVLRGVRLWIGAVPVPVNLDEAVVQNRLRAADGPPGLDGGRELDQRCRRVTAEPDLDHSRGGEFAVGLARETPHYPTRELKIFYSISTHNLKTVFDYTPSMLGV